MISTLRPHARLWGALVVGATILSSGLGGLSRAAASMAPRDTLVLAWETRPRSFDPRYAIDADSQYLENLLHCSLVDFSANGEVAPGLAEKWAWQDSKTLTMSLRAGAKFSDGSLVEATDVKATYDFFLQAKHKIPTPRAGAFAKLAGVTANGRDVTFTLKEADSTFLSNLSVGVLPQRFVAEKVLTADDKAPGCGPFMVTNDESTTITLDANPHYTLGATPISRHVLIKIVKDESTRFAKLRKGEVDISQNNISLEKVVDIGKSYKELDIVRRPGLRTTYVGFNVQDKFLSHSKVREAISLAINRQAIITYLLKGFAVPATTLLPSDSPYYNKALIAPAYDPALAKKLLDEAGFPVGKDGFRYQLSYKTTNDASRLAIAKTIASDLTRIGIKVSVQPLEWGRFKEDVDKGHVQIWGLNWIGFKDPDIYRYAFATESFPPNGGNRGRYSNPELDRLLEAARTMVDEQERQKLYVKAQELIDKEKPYAFLFHEENYAVVRKSVKNFAIYADGRYSSLKTAYKE